MCEFFVCELMLPKTQNYVKSTDLVQWYGFIYLLIKSLESITINLWPFIIRLVRVVFKCYIVYKDLCAFFLAT